MFLWAGIDEAGYGPPLGPLVVAATAFAVPEELPAGQLWASLGEAVVRRARRSDGRLVVNDSKQVYSRSAGLKRLEEGVLAFLQSGGGPARAADLVELVSGGRGELPSPEPWFRGALELPLPVATNPSALASKAAALAPAMQAAGVSMTCARAAVVFPPEFNRIVSRTRNKAMLLFQKCGLLLQEVWRRSGASRGHVLVDRHGGRMRYRDLLRDAFPGCRCDVRCEEQEVSSYLITDDDGRDDRALTVTFRENGDTVALPTALASMLAKYTREIYMLAFNAYWQERVDGLRPTAGYHADARRFLKDIAPALRAEGVDPGAIVRSC